MLFVSAVFCMYLTECFKNYKLKRKFSVSAHIERKKTFSLATLRMGIKMSTVQSLTSSSHPMLLQIALTFGYKAVVEIRMVFEIRAMVVVVPVGRIVLKRQ